MYLEGIDILLPYHESHNLQAGSINGSYSNSRQDLHVFAKS
jgi:hypothetical protein